MSWPKRTLKEWALTALAVYLSVVTLRRLNHWALWSGGFIEGAWRAAITIVGPAWLLGVYWLVFLRGTGDEWLSDEEESHGEIEWPDEAIDSAKDEERFGK